MTDAGRTYINPGPKHGVNHQMVEHNQFFVKKEGFPHWSGFKKK